MNQKTNHFSKFIFSFVFIALAFTACRRDESLRNDKTFSATTANSYNEKAPGNSAAAHIAASEKLAIPSAVAVPENFPNGNQRVATYYAVGVQKYRAQPKAASNPVQYEWVFVAPEAELYDANNQKIGTHGAGPVWQVGDANAIVAQQFSPARTAPGEDPESIDWLLLKPKTGSIPTGIFADVHFIQRIATKGGKAPLTPPSTASETIAVKYKAVYRFTKINP